MTSQPTALTVFLPVRNGELFIAEAIQSVLSQTHQNFELWVLENGSEDRTVQVVKSFKDPRLKLFELGPVGVQGALQYALDNAPTHWLARMDADDLMLPRRLETQVKFIEEHPDVVFVGTAYALLTPFGHIVERKLSAETRKVSAEMLAHNRRFFGDPTIVFSRSAALRAGGADFEFPSVDGVPLLFRLLNEGEGWEIAEYLHIYRVRPHSLSRNHQHHEQAFRVRQKYASEFINDKPQPSRQSVWEFVLNLEMITGDKNAIRHAQEFIEQENPSGSKVNSSLIMKLLGPFAQKYRKWRCGSIYRHRPDLERLTHTELTPAF